MSIANLEAACAPWPELDRRFLQRECRAVPPPFPLEVIAEAWRPWIEGHAQASTCTDYTAQALLAAVAAVCGSRFVVDVTPCWREPLVLWQALVGAPSTGKTAALVAARRLLAGVKAPPDPAVADYKMAPDELPLTPWMVHRGISSWYDDLDAWLVEVSRDREERFLQVSAWTGDPSHSCDHPLDVGKDGLRFPKSLFGAFQAGRLAETLSKIDDALLSQLLYCWPEPRLEARLDGASGDGARFQVLLQRLVDLPGTVWEPSALTLQEAAADRLQALLPHLRAFMREADGVEAAWIGKAAGTIVRLAGLLCLMDWAAADGEAPCTTVEQRHVERAHALWADYFWPQAQAVFGQAFSTLAERRVQRVGRWLRRMRPEMISREEVRREALGQTVDADTADRVLERLEQYGAVRMLPVVKESRRGPRRLRWEVNPALWAN
jgi:hypothetical protein